MSELRALANTARRLYEQRRAFVSATVVAVRGSGYRKPGARMIASEGEWLAGSISGGCLERDVITRGTWHTRDRQARLITYNEAEDALDERRGTGCQGVVDVLVERHEPDRRSEGDVFAAAERCIQDETAAAVITVVRSTHDQLPVGAHLVWHSDGDCAFAPEHAALRELFEHDARSSLAAHATPRVVERAGLSVLVETLTPPVHLLVLGTGHDAVPLVTLGKHLGWSVSVWDASPRTSARDRFLQADHYLTGSVDDAVARHARCISSAAVVMGHDFERDSAAVAALLASRVRYIGILGARNRSQQILADQRRTGLVIDESRVFAPVGLKLGAQTPAEIALVIAAQVQGVFASMSSPKAIDDTPVHQTA